MILVNIIPDKANAFDSHFEGSTVNNLYNNHK